MLDKMKVLCKFILCSFIVLSLTSCKNQSNSTIESEKKQFEQNVNNVVSIVSDIKNNSDYNRYYINGGTLYGYNLDINTKKYYYDLIYDISNLELTKGIIIKNNNSELYISVENKNYCAVKDFSDNNIKIYNILEKNKCHLNISNDSTIKIEIYGKNLEKNSDYVFGTVSNSYISLAAISNLIDNGNCTYKWYRNDEIIDSESFMNYVVNLDYEDANYYVEITTNTGEVYKSESVNVKINKQ